MALKEVGIIFNGATGRIGSTQHLANALAPIRAEGGLAVGADRILPRLMLVGRDGERLKAVAQTYGVDDWSTDLDAALAKPAFPIFFDAAATQQRVSVLTKAIAAGKHIYSEKPVAPSVAEGLALLAGGSSAAAQNRRGRGQALSAGITETVGAGAVRLFRPRHRIPARLRLVDFRWRRAAEPTPELELSAGWRAHHGYGSALALRDRRPSRSNSPRGDGGRDRDSRARR